MIRTAASALALLVALSASAVAQETSTIVVPGAASTPPPIGPAPAVRYPTPSATTLPNGIRVLAVRIAGAPITAAQLVLPAGALDDGVPGTAALTAVLLARGTQKHDGRALAAAQDELGATLGGSASLDRTSVTTSALNARFPDALALLAEVVEEPSFPEAEVTLAKSNALNGLRLRDNDPSALAVAVAQRALYGDPYGRPVSGSPATLEQISRATVLEFYRAHYGPTGAILAIAGDLAPSDAFALARRAFGGWSARGTSVVKATPVAGASRVIVVDQEAAGRTAIAVARPSVARGAAGYAAAAVANAVLSGYSGRLNQEVRVKRGLSYGAGAQLTSNRFGGSTVATTLVAHEKVGDALPVVVDTLGSIALRPPDAAELAIRRQVLLGGYAASLETPAGVVTRVADNAFSGLPADALATYPGQIGTVSFRDVTAADPVRGPRAIVLVGKASVFIDALRAKYPDVIVIPAANLDLLAPALTK